jgi:hypothetical protein
MSEKKLHCASGPLGWCTVFSEDNLHSFISDAGLHILPKFNLNPYSSFPQSRHFLTQLWCFHFRSFNADVPQAPSNKKPNMNKIRLSVQAAARGT